MDKFWEWMKENTYELNTLSVDGELTKISKIKSIGYMIEYVRDHKHWKTKQPFPPFINEFQMAVFGRDQYNCFKQVIEGIDNPQTPTNKAHEIF